MSNYFDALIRTSGYALRTDPPVAADYGITEIDVQHDAPLFAKPAAISVETARAVATAPAVPEAQARNTRQTGIDASPPVAATTPAPVTLEPAIRAAAASIGEKVEELVSTNSPQAPSEPSTRPQSDPQDVGQAMVHAALRWVTAEVQTPGAPTEIEIALEQPPRAGPAPDAATRPPEALTPLRVAPIRPSESIELPPPWASGKRRPATHEETVEIAIGAIHLRVDAPPPQTVVQAPAPTPRPTADRPPPRSALTRRVLRRL